MRLNRSIDIRVIDENIFVHLRLSTRFQLHVRHAKEVSIDFLRFVNDREEFSIRSETKIFENKSNEMFSHLSFGIFEFDVQLIHRLKNC